METPIFILYLWAGIGMFIAISTIGTINPYSKFYWDKISIKQKILMLFICGPIAWEMSVCILILNLLIPLLEKGLLKFNKFYDKLK